MDYLLNFASGVTLLSNSNHRICNVVNIYNFIIDILNNSSDDDRIDTVQSIKTHIGLTFFDDFRQYVMRKYPYDDAIVRLLNK